MALGNAIKGATRTPQTITWRRANGNTWNLTDGTLTGKIVSIARGSIFRAITGTLVLVGSGAGGKFKWTYSDDDIDTAGKFKVQFKSTYGDDTYDLTEKMDFEVLEIIE